MNKHPPERALFLHHGALLQTGAYTFFLVSRCKLPPLLSSSLGIRKALKRSYYSLVQRCRIPVLVPSCKLAPVLSSGYPVANCPSSFPMVPCCKLVPAFFLVPFCRLVPATGASLQQGTRRKEQCHHRLLYTPSTQPLSHTPTHQTSSWFWLWNRLCPCPPVLWACPWLVSRHLAPVTHPQ